MRSILALVLCACATSTGGQQVAITADLVADAPTEQRDGAPVIAFRSDEPAGEVVLHTAQLAVGPVYLWSLPPDLDGGSWASMAIFPRAHAQDQVSAGRLVGEVPHQQRIDLLREDRVALGGGSGIEGSARSVDIWLEPTRSGPTLAVAGTFTPDDGEALDFRADITWATPWIDEEAGNNAVLLRRVRGLPATLELVPDRHIDIGIDARAWIRPELLNGLAALPADSGGVRHLGPDDQAGRSLDGAVRRIGPTGPWRVRGQD